MSGNMYMELLNCNTPEEVYAKVRDWASTLSDHEHLVRSTILDIHADVERAMKQTLYHILLGIMFRANDEAEYERQCEKLEKMATKLNFATVHRILKPAFDAFPAPELADIQQINEVRNLVAHRQDMNQVVYKGRSLFSEPDCLAQLYLDGWAIRSQIGQFFQKMISDPRGLAEHYARFYHENYALP